MSDHDHAEELYRELAATESMAIDPRANRWIGEAQAVAREIRAPASTEVRREGAEQIVRLLTEIEETENERADEHVERALSLAGRLAQT